MLWDISVIPNEQDKRYLMLPPGVLHMSALGRFGRFTPFFTSRLTLLGWFNTCRNSAEIVSAKWKASTTTKSFANFLT